MARLINKLSARQVQILKAEGMHSDGGGLYLRIADGNRYWVFRYASRATGKDRQLGIGPTHTFSLAEAREKARTFRQMLADGRDPLDERRSQEASSAIVAAKGTMTFDQCRDAYIAAHEASWSSAMHRRQWEDSLKRYVTPVFGTLPVSSIDTPLVLKAIEPIWKTRTETASRIRNRIELILDWARVRSYRADVPNPARWRGHFDKLLPKPGKVAKVKNHAALPYAEIGHFMVELRQRETIGARGLEFAILTAARTDEVLKATWSEFDPNAKIWTVPPEHMKNRKQHRVPLSPAAIAVIEKMRAMKHSDQVFPIARIDRDLAAIRDDVTVHGFRSTFRTWAGDETNFPRELAEKALAHTVGDETERAYDRGELLKKRGKLMEAWANFCARPAATANNVTPLRKQAPA